MQLTREQRIDNTTAIMVNQLRDIAKDYKATLETGLNWPAKDGYPELKATPEEIKESLDESMKDIQTFINFVLNEKPIP